MQTRSGKMFGKLPLVVRVLRSVVIRQKRELMTARQLPGNIVGTDITAAVHRQQLVRFDPKNSQNLSTHLTQATRRPVTNLTKATAAAELRTTNVRAASATRASGPSEQLGHGD